jgi:hypothetical protein
MLATRWFYCLEMDALFVLRYSDLIMGHLLYAT